MTEKNSNYGCNTCDFIWAIKLPGGKIIEFAAGQLKQLDEDMYYNDDNVPRVLFGAISEVLGGNIGKLILCLQERFEELRGKEIEILIEGRWRKILLR